ncbi:GGDEF domain-containing protein [Crenothrix polyspora]|uniref:diguanylate cyclase n=1 Tax=Crenothrix polyspora TaxID=360316 RepID=A0A1R4HFV4_9GAMM|nr:GGDEF domain-containing protein [Crenothrix polyspora]SJM95109.1 Diguanylate cyclase [Crenothrix polyspora]
MGFFTKDVDKDKWKNKYLELLNVQQQTADMSREKEELLCKAIIRLALAASGFNAQLDQYLHSIRHHLEKGIDSSTLKKDLEHFIDTLGGLNADNYKSSSDTGFLFDFLLRQYTDTQQQSALQALRNTNTSDNQEQLFNTLLAIINLDVPSAGLVEGIVNQIDIKIVSDQLLRLLEGIDIPIVFSQQAHAVKQELVAVNTAVPFVMLLDRSISLLLQIKQHNQLERQDIDKFLIHITEQLAELDQTVHGANEVALESELRRSKLDQSLSEQIEELQLTSNNATKLESLKEIINDRLIKITTEIQDYNQKESARRKKTQLQLEELTQKVKEMDAESKELKSKLERASAQAFRDALTGLPNRLAYEDRLHNEYARWKRYQMPLSMIIWDIDLFKQANDEFGHKYGDEVLRTISKKLSEHCRETDFISRFGGEEFTMLLPNTDKAMAVRLANQLRYVIEQTDFNYNGRQLRPITISCGVTEFMDDDTSETAFERADSALYKAKQQGRNQCCSD